MVELKWTLIFQTTHFSVRNFIYFSCRRADAVAGVRKQGCTSLTQAYCMVGQIPSVQLQTYYYRYYN